jgi:hypothetical protein
MRVLLAARMFVVCRLGFDPNLLCFPAPVAEGVTVVRVRRMLTFCAVPWVSSHEFRINPDYVRMIPG